MALITDILGFRKYRGVRGGLGMQVVRTHKKTLTFADLTTAGASQAIDITTTDDDGIAFPADALLVGASRYLHIPFTGGSLSAMTLKAGDAGDDDELYVATSIFSGSGFSWKPGVYTPWTKEAAYSGLATFTSTGGNVNTATAGKVELHLYYFVPQDPYVRIG